MEFIHRFFLLVAVTASLCLVTGLYKPWIVLWWEDKQNRKKVLKIYGSATLINFAVYTVLQLI